VSGCIGTIGTIGAIGSIPLVSSGHTRRFCVMSASFAGFLVTTRTTGEMRLVTRTESTGAKVATDTRSVDVRPRPRCSRSTDCRCGQQLDLSLRAHCPRCGRSVARG